MTSKPFVLTRTFDAPRNLVWEAMTDAEHLKHWFGPTGLNGKSLRLPGLLVVGVVADRTPDTGRSELNDGGPTDAAASSDDQNVIGDIQDTDAHRPFPPKRASRLRNTAVVPSAKPTTSTAAAFG